MLEKKELDKIKKKRDDWENNFYSQSVKVRPEHKKKFENLSFNPIKNLYTPDDIAHLDYEKDMGYPGLHPFLRGVYPTMYRGQLWTMRQFSGFGSAEETNQRYKYLLDHGETGLSVAFDYPTLYGYDTDHPMSRGEFGKCGVAISSLQDMGILFDAIPIDKITTSMTMLNMQKIKEPIVGIMATMMVGTTGMTMKVLTVTMMVLVTLPMTFLVAVIKIYIH